MAQDFPVQRTCPFAPPAEYAKLRDEAPVVRAKLPRGEAWLVTRWAEARQVLSSPAISTATTTPGSPKPLMSPDPPTPEMLEELAGQRHGVFIDMDPPEHTRYRKLLIPEFSYRRIKEMQPGMQATADRLIDDMLAQGTQADLVEAFALPLPSLVICQLLGVPYSEREFFQNSTRRLLTAPDEVGQMAAVGELREFLSGLVAEAERAPGDDLLGRLVTARAVPHEDMVGMMFLLLVAGHETTANMLPLSVLSLVRHPDQLRQLLDDPGLWPGAVEELLRFHSIVDWAGFDRAATQDIEIGGRKLGAGDGIFVLGASANHDERVFPDPDRFDIHREARPHVAFGYGIHQCLGQNLARAELEIALRTLFERIPGLRVDAPDEELSFKYSATVFGVDALPVSW
ncbi:cytochrome P450 [Spongiactinospora rosea]|uniref:Cytochrome P450 n=1 Tax=Spongiactinospora rosea TaxID=2248750 RepID=A0A366M6Z8_9ACTN|nr:cytochrome P450 [Spongiactinospora rosea]RBQ21319.1 cytochrome P450 [Spongiactinospora rosea]